MSDIKRVAGFLNGRKASGEKFCLATVVRVQGSAYRQPGAKMIISQTGAFAGNISGGCLEMDVIKKAKKCIESGIPKLLHYDNSPESKSRIGASLGCNGIIDILVEPLNDEIATFLNELPTRRKESVITTVIETSAPKNIQPGTHFINHEEFNKEFQTFNSSGKRFDHIEISSNSETFTLFIEKIKPLPHLIIFGAGFDTYPLIRMADELGWLISVTSDSYAVTIKDNFALANNVVFLDRDEISEFLEFDEWTYAVLMSHSYDYDLAVLKQLINCNLPYIGLLGPRSRSEKMLGEIGSHNIESAIIYNPVGLDLGGDAPPELALSIIAEIQSLIYKRVPQNLKLGKGHIHAKDEF